MTTKTTDRTRLAAKGLGEAYRAGIGSAFKIEWTGGQSIRVIRTGQGFTLSYSRPNGPHGERVEHRERVDVESRPCPFGGYRLFLICPKCTKPRTALYGAAPFACRACYGLVYLSQLERDIYARYDRGQAIANRLAGRYVTLDESFPDRPKGMHKRTYEAQRVKWDRLTRPARDYAGALGFGDLADHSEAMEAGRMWREVMAHRRTKAERREARKADLARDWKAAYYATMAQGNPPR